MKGTNLQDVYDRFFLKVDENISGKESLVFELLLSAIAKSYKDVVCGLGYVLDEPQLDEDVLYSGHFVETLLPDEIELLATWMFYEWNRRRQQKLLGQKRMIGTQAFNRLENVPDMLRSINYTMGQIKNEINELKNGLYSYKYS